MPNSKPLLLFFLPPSDLPGLLQQVQTLRNLLDERVRMIEVEAGQHPMIFQSFKVEAFPALVLLEHGVERWRQEGIVSLDTVELLGTLPPLV